MGNSFFLKCQELERRMNDILTKGIPKMIGLSPVTITDEATATLTPIAYESSHRD